MKQCANNLSQVVATVSSCSCNLGFFLITLNKKKITLTKGKKFKIKAKAKSDKKVRNHIAKFRYESTNTNVAEVSSKGVVKAIGKGKTVIYVFGQNGISQKIKVAVK